MDLSPGLLLSSLLIGTVGVGLFMYGKRQADLKFLGAGVFMAAFPYFVHSLLLMWVIAGACSAALFVANRSG